MHGTSSPEVIHNASTLKAICFTCEFLGVYLRMEEENEVVKTFEELGVREELVKACERLGWKNPTKIQAEALPYALEGTSFGLLLLC